MRHLVFPTMAQADAFLQDLRDQGVIRPEMGTTSLQRGTTGVVSDAATPAAPMTDMDAMGSGSAAMTSGVNHIDELDDELDGMGGGTAEDAGAGAIKGTGVGVVVGAIAGTVATVATGGLAAVPVILGMAALGSGVGAGVGAIGGASGVDETSTMPLDADSDTIRADDDYPRTSVLTDEQHDRVSDLVGQGSHVIAVADSVPADIVRATAERHGGQFV